MPTINSNQKTPYDYSKCFDSSDKASINLTKKDIDNQKTFAKEFLIATIKNQIPDEKTDFSSTIKLMMDTFEMEQRAHSMELQVKQLDISKGILLSGLKTFIGTSVETNNQPFYYDSKDISSVEMLLNLPKDSVDAKIFIESSNGDIFVDDISALQDEYFWNGKLNNDTDAKSGFYKAFVEVTYIDGKTEIILPTIKRKITGISIDEKGVPKLLSGKDKIHELYGVHQNGFENIKKEIEV